MNSTNDSSFSSGSLSGESDTEGHIKRFRATEEEDATTDDAEGHGHHFKRQQPTDPKSVADDADGDAEGHAFKHV